jgi:MFS transporter, FHS family, L-fucose permease
VKKSITMHNKSSVNIYLVILIYFVFLVIALLSSVLGAIIPDLIKTFTLSLTAASLIHVSFYGAYLLFAIPAGILVERIFDKPVLLIASFFSLIGILVFASMPVYHIILPSFLLIGIAMTMLQVSVNPLLRVAGGAENYAFLGALAQLIYGLGSGLSPALYSWFTRFFSLPVRSEDFFIVRIVKRLIPLNLSFISVYWLFMVIVIVMFFVILFSHFPRIDRTSNERVGAISNVFAMLKTKTVQKYTLVIFLYVACEQGNSYWISQFLNIYHDFNPQITGALVLSWYWWCLGLGCIGGMVLLKFFDSRKVLIFSTTASMISFAISLFGPGDFSKYAFPCVGLFQSVMWPILFSLALNSVRSGQGVFSGILCTAITGGAAGVFVIGRLGDLFGLRAGMSVLFIGYFAVLSVGFWARPIINNKVYRRKKLLFRLYP